MGKRTKQFKLTESYSVSERFDLAVAAAGGWTAFNAGTFNVCDLNDETKMQQALQIVMQRLIEALPKREIK